MIWDRCKKVNIFNCNAEDISALAPWSQNGARADMSNLFAGEQGFSSGHADGLGYHFSRTSKDCRQDLTLKPDHVFKRDAHKERCKNALYEPLWQVLLRACAKVHPGDPAKAEREPKQPVR